jgi:Family of unknown function (DUF5362)
MIMETQASADLFDLRIDPQTSGFLSESAKWARFLAIVGFIFCGLIVLVAVFAGSVLSSAFRNFAGEGGLIGSAFITVFYILFALLLFFPCLFLYNFSTKMLIALRTNDQELLTTSFKNLKSWFRFYGIVTIVVLALYGLGIILALVGAAFH